MTAQIIPFRRVDQVLRKAERKELQSVIVIGFDREGNFYSDAEDVTNERTAMLLLLALWKLMEDVHG